MDWDYISGVVRHFLTTFAGGLVAHGYMTQDDSQAIVGGIVAALGVGWSMVQKRGQKSALAAAQASPAPVGK